MFTATVEQQVDLSCQAAIIGEDGLLFLNVFGLLSQYGLSGPRDLGNVLPAAQRYQTPKCSIPTLSQHVYIFAKAAMTFPV